MSTRFKTRPSLLSFKERRNLTFSRIGDISLDIKPLMYVENFWYSVIRHLLLQIWTSATLSSSQQSFFCSCIARIFGCQLLSYEMAFDTWPARLSYSTVWAAVFFKFRLDPHGLIWRRLYFSWSSRYFI